MSNCLCDCYINLSTANTGTVTSSGIDAIMLVYIIYADIIILKYSTMQYNMHMQLNITYV